MKMLADGSIFMLNRGKSHRNLNKIREFHENLKLPCDIEPVRKVIIHCCFENMQDVKPKLIKEYLDRL